MRIVNQFSSIQAHETTHKSICPLIIVNSQNIGARNNLFSIQCIHSSVGLFFSLVIDISCAWQRVDVVKLHISVWFLDFNATNSAVLLEKVEYIAFIESYGQLLDV